MLQRRILIVLTAILVAGCSGVYHPQELPKSGSSEEQQGIALTVIPLTSASAAEANRAPFPRRVIVGSNLGGAARLVEEPAFIDLKLPPDGAAPPYRVGVGDVLQFARLMPSVNDAGQVTDQYSVRLLPVTSEGYVSIVEVGRVDVEGKTISEVEGAISGALLRSGVDPRFEVSVNGFNSQKIYLGGTAALAVNSNVASADISASSSAIAFTDRPISLDEVMTSAGIGVQPGADKLVKIFRDGREYRVSARDVLTRSDFPRIYLHGGDRVFVEDMHYRSEAVVMTGAVGSRSLFEISAEKRQTLSDALFSTEALAPSDADSSQIYLLRRSGDGAVAYHLDGSDPTRLSIATEIELRPRDVVFVAEQPISRFNRVVQQLLGVAGAAGAVRDAAAP